MSRSAFKPSGSSRFASALGGLLLAVACSNYLGSGPDPARAGRVDGGTVGTGGGDGCNPLQALVQNGDPAACTSLLSCEEQACAGSFRSCFGQNYQTGDLSGGRCAALASCVVSCGCSSDCLSRCNPQGDCASCLNSVTQCHDNNCQSARSTCAAGGGGNGGTGGGPTELVPGVAVNDLALDADTVFFTSNQGLAKVAKAGGAAVPLGGFSQLNGLAVDAQAIYTVGNDGSLLAERKDGTAQQTLSTAICGGGSGSVVLSAANVFYTTGPYLRIAPFTLATASDLATDVWQAGGPATGARLALDSQNIYYLGASNSGGQAALYGVSRLSSGGTSCAGMIARGDRVATPKGTLVSLVGDGTKLYFTDLTSNGLSPELVVSALATPSLGPSSVTDLATLSAGSINAPSAGTALASDGTYLYFGGFLGIYRVLVGGPSCLPSALPCGPPELLVPGALASALAVDEGFLYYGDQSGQNSLKKIAK